LGRKMKEGKKDYMKEGRTDGRWRKEGRKMKE
jgi:hypothetical protein